MSKVLVDRELLERAAARADVFDDGSDGADAESARSVSLMLREALAQPAEAEGVEVVAWANPEDLLEIKKPGRLVARYVIGSRSGAADVPLVRQSDHLAALSAVTAERDRLQQFEAAYNEWHDKTEWVQKTAEAHELGKHRADVLKDRVDQLQAEVERLRNELAGKPLVC
jgi:uncharacterized small protein (DUF1192 family)